ncbi:hypothetical protein ACHQM5_000458 [Ranunculus cassubicifolius]
MKGENDDQLGETMHASPQKKAKRRYSRELLLSLSELEICSKLPSGFDRSILSEFEDASNSIPERPRLPGSLSSQNFRRGEYGASPPTRGDIGNSSRGPHGRWDTRSTGSNDRDSDSQLDSESDSGWRVVSHSRRAHSNVAEHDGLLGSGLSPKPSGFTSATVTKGRGSTQYQLNRTHEPYQPPRPYKAAPHSRRDATDVINEETFGSSESSSQDRAEEERKRRASFEQFRKEQKELHEKQKQFPEKHKENVDPGMAALLGNSDDDAKLWDKTLGSEDMPRSSQGASGKSSSIAQTAASRPLVPPGFTGAVEKPPGFTGAVEKNVALKSSSSHLTTEVGNGGVDVNTAQTKANVVTSGTSDKPVNGKPVPLAGKSEKQYDNKTNAPITEILSGAMYENSAGIIRDSYINSTLPEGVDSYSKKIPGNDVKGIAIPEQSTSILAKLFGKTSPADSVVTGFSEPSDGSAHNGSPSPSQSSKFTHWFLEEEKKPEVDFSFDKPEDLLSLIVNGEKTGFQASRVSDKNSSLFPFENNDLICKPLNTTTPTTTEPSYSGGSQSVLTCEDLEQSILSEFSDKSSSPSHSFQAPKTQKKTQVDNQASHHLLSLLQKGTSSSSLTPESFREPPENLQTESDKNLTLETLFGSAFMQELHSFNAPVSVQRNAVGGATQSNIEGDSHVANHVQPNKLLNEEPAWLGFEPTQSKVDKRGNDTLDIQLPDEESLITLSEPVSSSSSSMPVDIVDKLAALNAVLKKERSTISSFEDPPFLRGPRPEPPFQNHLQMNHGRHPFQPSESPPNIRHPEFPQHHFPGNLAHPSFQHVGNGPARFSPPAHQHPMLQQMQMQGNMLPPHMLRGHPRGVPMPPYGGINHMSGGYSPEPNPMQNFPFGHHQPNYNNGLDLPVQGHGVGGNNRAEAYEKLIEMELRANLKQMPYPSAGAGHNLGNHGHGIDMSFRYNR